MIEETQKTLNKLLDELLTESVEDLYPNYKSFSYTKRSSCNYIVEVVLPRCRKPRQHLIVLPIMYAEIFGL